MKKFQLPPGARLLCAIEIDKGKAVVSPEPDVDELARAVAERIGGHVEQHGSLPEWIKAWQDLAQECAEWQAKKAR